ncbi:MAG: GTP pyrophosphokinase [Miniphocaeibacter sp.]|uniref:GTP pyrophosphokinase n=1 Tax=Miniphocaeibacter sp. TaxID=3100973 RepID=UPI003BB16AE1
MKLDMFQFIDSSVDYINTKKDFINYVAKEVNRFFYKLLEDDDFFLNSNYRIKMDNSIKEKMLRQNFFNKLDHPREVLDYLNDIVGVRLECRFNSDEEIIFNRIKDTFHIKGDGEYFKTDLNDNIYLNMSEEQPQYQKNGFEIYKIDGKYIDGDEELLFELQIKSMVNVFWGEIDHIILYKNFNYMITEDFIRNIMYSIKSNLEMVDSQLNNIYDRLKDIEESKTENTKSQLKSILSKSIHDTYILKLKKETGLLIDLRLISDLVVDFLFAKLEIDDDINSNNRIIELFDTINQLNRKKMVFGKNIILENIKYRNNLNKKLGNSMKITINKDFRWNLCLKIIIDLIKEENNIIFIQFIDYIVHTISYRVGKAVEGINLCKRDRHKLKYDLLNVIIDFYCKDLDINYFNIEDMRKLQVNIEKFLENISKPEDLLDLDINEFEDIMCKQYM